MNLKLEMIAGPLDCPAKNEVVRTYVIGTDTATELGMRVEADARFWELPNTEYVDIFVRVFAEGTEIECERFVETLEPPEDTVDLHRLTFKIERCLEEVQEELAGQDLATA